MAVLRPYRRTCRIFTDGSYANSGQWMYVLHPKYADVPMQYIRAFILLLKDMQALFDYVEPSDRNLSTYSYRIHELLLRSCVEVEANCKAILVENGYVKRGNMDIDDYRKIDKSHRLSSYRVTLPVWHGTSALRQPFLAWKKGGPLPWYRAYNETKHDRHYSFHQATFEHMVDAICGVVVLLSSQFYTHDFSPSDWTWSAGGHDDGMESAIGGYFRVSFPKDWPPGDKYGFDWQALRNDPDPFDTIDYAQIK